MIQDQYKEKLNNVTFGVSLSTKKILLSIMHTDIQVFVGAAKCDNLDMLKWLIDTLCQDWGYVHEEFVCAEAAKHGRMEMLEYLYEKNYLLDETVCTASAGGGHLDVLI